VRSMTLDLHGLITVQGSIHLERDLELSFNEVLNRLRNRVYVYILRVSVNVFINSSIRQGSRFRNG
jgi:hypothetical protein